MSASPNVIKNDDAQAEWPVSNSKVSEIDRNDVTLNGERTMTRDTTAWACIALAWGCLGAVSAHAQVGLEDAQGLVFDKAGLLWVANRASSQLLVYNVDQSPPVQVRVLGQDIHEPYGLAYDGTDIYVANYESSTITVYNALTGAEDPDATISGIGQPTGVAVDADGMVYVTGPDNNYVVVCRYGGPNQCAFDYVVGDTTGTSFLSPSAISIVGDALFLGFYTAEQGYGPATVREYSVANFFQPDGPTPILVIPIDQPMGNETRGIAVSKDNRALWVTDDVEEEVNRYRLSDGRKQLTISQASGGFAGIAVRRRRIYVSGATSISVYTDTGAFLYSF